MLKGNNGEISQDGWRILETDDWLYRDGALRVEFSGPYEPPEDDAAPVHVVLRNGEQEVVKGMFLVHGDVCEGHGIARLCLRPVVELRDDLMPTQDR